MINVFSCFADAYQSSVREVMTTGQIAEPTADPLSVGSGFGRKLRKTREILCHKFVVSNPRDRCFHSSERDFNLAFSHANFIWTLTGGGNVDAISFYNARGLTFARNTAFYEAAFGARLFYPFQQIFHVERRLKGDNASRRALAMIYIPEDTQIDKLDTPCATYLHFMIRNDRLVCICNMRSQSALMVLPYDFSLFSMIHELLALRLHLELGDLIYTSNSFHIYEDEFDLAQAFIDNRCASFGPDARMMVGDDVTIANLIVNETRMRLGCCDSDDGNAILDPYWNNFLQPIRHFCSVPK